MNQDSSREHFVTKESLQVGILFLSLSEAPEKHYNCNYLSVVLYIYRYFCCFCNNNNAQDHCALLCPIFLLGFTAFTCVFDTYGILTCLTINAAHL